MHHEVETVHYASINRLIKTESVDTQDAIVVVADAGILFNTNFRFWMPLNSVEIKQLEYNQIKYVFWRKKYKYIGEKFSYSEKWKDKYLGR